MFKISLNELIALQIVINDISVEDLLIAAAEKFFECKDEISKENEVVCRKALETFFV